MARWLLLQPKHRLFQAHHERLRANPDPAQAEMLFQRRLKQARQVHNVRVACYVGLYFAFAAATVGVILARLPALEKVRSLTELVAGLASSLTIAFLVGVFLTNRFQGLVEIELHYYSEESRMKPPETDLT